MSLVHWWPLNGNTLNYGSSPNDLITYGTIAYQEGKIGRSIRIDGVVYFDSSYQPTNTMTLAFWIYPDNPLLWRDMFCFGSNLGRIEYSNSTTRQHTWYHSAGSGADLMASGTPLFTLGNQQWYHIAMTIDGTNVKFYVNGELKCTAPQLNPLPAAMNDNLITWARRGTSTTAVYDARYDDIRIYDHALTAGEIKEISKGLLVHYNFEELCNEPTVNYLANKTLGWGNRWQEVTEYPAGITPQARVLKRISQNTYFGSANAIFSGVDLNVDNWKGKYLTLSCWYYRGTAATSKIYVLLSNSNYYTYTEQVSVTNRDVVGAWAYGTCTVRIKDTLPSTDPIYYVNGCAGGNDGDILYIADPQLEIKSYATPYVNGTRALGTVYDNSGYGYDATPGDNVDFTTATCSGTKALKLQGATVGNPNNSYIYCDHIPDLNIWTVNIWMTMHTNASHGPEHSLFCGKTPTGNFDGYTKLDFQNGGTRMSIRCTLNNGSTYNDYPIGSASITLNVPHMYTWVSDGTTVSGYIDGVLLGTVTPATQYHNLFNPGSLGKAWSDGHWNPDADIDDFRVWSTALSAADILTEYQRKAAITKPGQIITGEIVETAVAPRIIDKYYTTRATAFTETADHAKIFGSYTQLESLQFNGAQYIQTNVTTLTAPFEVEVVYDKTNTSTNDQCLFGERNLGKFTNIYGSYYESAFGETASGSVPGNTGRHTITTKSASGLYEDGVRLLSGSLGNRTGTFGALIGAFTESSSFSAKWFFNGLIYSIKIYENNGRLTHYFMPVKRSDGILGMLDYVDGKFYTNSGSGSFTAGPELGTLSMIQGETIHER